MKNKIKVLLFDIETMPNLVRTWRKYEQNVIWYERHGYLWSISWKYLGEKKIYHKNITDFPLYKKDKYSDKALVQFIWQLLDDVDIVIAHNGRAFDVGVIHSRFLHYELDPPSPFQIIDTKVLYKKYLREDSNSLNDIAEKHGLPMKVETGGYQLWKKCEEGDPKAIKLMEEYNNHDVYILELAYLRIRPYAQSHPNIALLMGERIACPNCGSPRMHKRGAVPTLSGQKQRWQCQGCGAWKNSPLKEGSQIR